MYVIFYKDVQATSKPSSKADIMKYFRDDDWIIGLKLMSYSVELDTELTSYDPNNTSHYSVVATFCS